MTCDRHTLGTRLTELFLERWPSVTGLPREEDGMGTRIFRYQSQRRDLLSSVFLDADRGDVCIPVSVLSAMSNPGTTEIPLHLPHLAPVIATRDKRVNNTLKALDTPQPPLTLSDIAKPTHRLAR
ncbi:hypothetical protein PM082_011053 [Marasmius tenuissimus]|nr:hypothetical protein PM082_011053 [Marasmius tenuissimus]